MTTKGLRERAQIAVVWNTGFNLFRDLLQFAVMLALVRILTPDAYGQFGLVTAIIGFASVLAYNNFLGHTLQVRSDDELHYQDHFTAGAVIQIGLFAITNAVAVVVARLWNDGQVGAMVHAMSIVFLLEWPCELRRKMLERDLDWKRLRLLHAIGLLAGAVAAIAMALAGAGAFSLLLPGLLVTIPFIYDLFFNLRWRPTWSWSWPRYRNAWRFGLNRIGSSAVTSGRVLCEGAVLSQLVGFAQYGFVGRAVGLGQIMCFKLAMQLMYAIYPVLTKIERNSPRYRKASATVLATVAWTVVPIAIVFGALSDPVVRVVYGSKWLEVSALLPWAMTVAALAAVGHAGYMLLLGHEQQRLCLLADATLFATTAASLWWLLPFGVEAYVAGLAGGQLLTVVLTLTWLRQSRAIETSGLTSALVPPAVSGLVSLAVAEAAAAFAGGRPEAFFPAVAYGVIFSVVYLLVLRVAFKGSLRELIAQLPGKSSLSRLFWLPALP